MRIADIQPLIVNVSAKTNWFFLKVRLDTGTHGYGEASLNGWESPMLAYLDTLREDLAGHELDAARVMLRTHSQSPGGLISSSIRSGIEQALLDAEARALGVPLNALLGPRKRNAVRMYANINRATIDRTPDGCAQSAQRAVAQGFTAVKIAPFDGVRRAELATRDAQRAIDIGVERVFAIRKAIGVNVELMVDCHWRFNEPTALAVAKRLAPAGLFWLECPVPETPSWHGALGRLREALHALGMRLAGAETQSSIDGFRPFIEPPLLDVIMPDVKYAGGSRPTLAIANLAHANGVVTSPHNPTGPVCTYASLHVSACVPDIPFLELQVGESPLYFDLVSGTAPALVNGCFEVPTVPGLGVDLDEALARAHPFRRVPYGPEEQLS